METESKLPQNTEIDLNSFIDELRAVDAGKLEKAIRWVKTQDCFDNDSFVTAFFIKYTNAAIPEAYLETAKCCNNLLENFEENIDDRIMTLLEHWYGKCQQEEGFRKLLKSIDRINRLYAYGISSWRLMNHLLCSLMSKSLNINQKVAVLRVLLGRNVSQNLKKEQVDQKFLAFTDLLKFMIDNDEYGGELTITELDEIKNVLLEMNFFSSKDLRYHKMVDIQSYVDGFCYEVSNLKQTLNSFETLKLTLREEFDNFAFRISYQAIADYHFQEKLAVMLAHLQNKVFRDHKASFKHALEQHVKARLMNPVKMSAEEDPEDDLIFISFVYLLHENDLIEHSLITSFLQFFMAAASEHGDPRFAELFPKVEDKLKAEISESDFQLFHSHMMERIVRGSNKTSTVNVARRKWLKKIVEDRKLEANRLRRKQAAKEVKNLKKYQTLSDFISIEPIDIKDAVEGFCEGVYSFTKVIEHFNASKNLTSSGFCAIAQTCFENAICRPQYCEQLVNLLKNLSKHVSEHLSETLSRDFYGYLIEALDDVVPEYLQLTSELNLERNLNFVRYLRQLFVEGVIEEHLIVNSLDLFIADGGEAAKKCFVEVFEKVREKVKLCLRYQAEYLTEKKFRRYERFMTTANLASQTTPGKRIKKNSVEPRSKLQAQMMVINIQEINNTDKLNETVENLKNVLNSDDRMKIFIKHILERRETHLKEILLHAKLLIALAKSSDESFEFKDCVASTINAEYRQTNASTNIDKKKKAKLNRIEIISGELWRNNLMATKKFAGLLLSKNMHLLPTESLAHITMIVAKAVHSEGNSKLKLAVGKFEPFIHDSIMKGWSDLKDGLEDVGAELQMLLSYEKSLSKAPN